MGRRMTEGLTLEKMDNALALLTENHNRKTGGKVSGYRFEYSAKLLRLVKVLLYRFFDEPVVYISSNQKKDMDLANRERLKTWVYNIKTLCPYWKYPTQEELDSKDATYGVLHKVSHPFGGIVNESYKKTEDRVASYFSGEF